MKDLLLFCFLTAFGSAACRSVLIEDGSTSAGSTEPTGGATTSSASGLTSGAGSTSGTGVPLLQGAQGTTTKAVGNFQCCPSDGTISPISVPIHVIAGLVPYVSYEDPPQLADLTEVTSTQSDALGHYSVGLPPGTYTLFAEIDGVLYLNCYDDAVPSSPSYCPVQVQPGVFTVNDIEDNSQAVY